MSASCRHSHRPWHWSSSVSKSSVAKPWTQIPALAHLSHDLLSFPAEAGGAYTALCLWDTATALLLSPPRHQPGHGTRAQPRNTAGRSQLRISATKTREAPVGEALSSWCIKAWGQRGGTLIWWSSLYFSSFISKFSPTKILPKKLAIPNTGNNSHDICSWPHPPQSFFILAYSAYELAENNSPLAQWDLNSTTIPKHSGKNWAWFVKT